MIGRKAEFGKNRRGNCNINNLLGQALHIHFRYTVDCHKAHAQVRCEIPLLLRAQSFGRDGIEHPENITEIVVDDRGLRPGRKLPFYIADAPPHLIPDLGDFVRTVARLDFHGDLGHSRHRSRLDPIELHHLLKRILDDVSYFFLDFHRCRTRIGDENKCGL